MPRNTIRHDELLKRIKKFGIIEYTKRGKGSHRMLYQESTRNNYPIKYHGKQTEYSKAVLKNIIRKFDLPEGVFD